MAVRLRGRWGMFSFITPWTLGWIAGTAVQLQQAELWAGAGYEGLAFAALALALAVALGFAGALTFAVVPAFEWRRASVGWRLCFGFALAFALAFAQTGLRASRYLDSALDPALEGRTLQVVGTVANLAQRMGDSVRFRFEVDTAVAPDGTPVQLPPQLLLGWYGNRLHAHDELVQPPPTDLTPGDRWQFALRLKAPHGHINPHGFDYELWLWEQDLQATGYVRNGAKDTPPQWLGASWGHPVERLRQSARRAIDAQVPDRATAGIVAALLVGDQAAIERADWDVFRATGVAHLMAISGLHITGLAWLAAVCVGWLWRRSDGVSPQRPWSLWLPAPLAARVCGVCAALAYAVFTGWGVPAQRTVWMLAVVTGLRWYGLRWPWPQVWLSVCAVVLALDPWAFMQAGFWLSFVAVGVLFASGSQMQESLQQPAHMASQASTRHAWLLRAAGSVGSAVKRMWQEQWLMSVCLAPLTLLLFHQLSLVGLLANLVAVPWVTLVVTPLCLIGLVVPQAWGLAALGLQGLVVLLGSLAHVPWAQWSAPAAPMWAGAAALLGMACLALRMPAWVRCFGVVWVLPVLVWQNPRPAQGTFDLLAADMGQGHAVLLRTATHSLLYDTGPRYSAETDAGQRVLVPLLRARGERLDRIVISHQDSDHSGGAPAVMAMQPQADVLTSMPVDHVLQQLHPMQRCERGQSWAWDGVQFEVLHPRAEDYAGKPKPNALSCVLRVTSPTAAALLAGDIEAPQEKILLQSGQTLQADWLLVPHHGSTTSSTAPFLEAVQPRIAMVQAGYRNRFGHPRPEVLARYQSLGVQVVQNTRCGASQWHSDSPNLVQCERNEQRRYWQHRIP
jgi:competence protein ComEC